MGEGLLEEEVEEVIEQGDRLVLAFGEVTFGVLFDDFVESGCRAKPLFSKRGFLFRSDGVCARPVHVILL